MKRFVKESVKNYERKFDLPKDDDESDEEESNVFNGESDREVVERLFTEQELIIMNERLKDLNVSFQKSLSQCFTLNLPYKMTENDTETIVQSKTIHNLLPTNEEAGGISSCSIFTKGFFKIDEETGAYILDKELLGEQNVDDVKTTAYGFISRGDSSASTSYKAKNQMTNHKQLLHKDVNAYLEKESVLTGVEDKIMAPVLRSSSFSKTEKKEQDKLTSLLDPNYKSSTLVHKTDNAGTGWNNMAAPRMTIELKQELLAMKLKRAAEGEGKRLKKDKVTTEDDLDENNLPKYFQIGTIVENAKEFYSDRVSKKKRQQSFLDELIQEDKETGYVTQRYHSIQDKLDQVQKRKKRKLMKKMAKSDKGSSSSKK